jgi:hypothetical protein
VTRRSKKKQQLISVIADTARAVLIARSYDSDVRLQVETLLGCLGYTLSGEQVLEELKALRAGRNTILVGDASATARGTRPPARVSRLWSQLRRKRE